MPSLRRHGWTLALASLLAANPASFAQAPDALPSSLSGRVTVIPPGGTTMISTWSMRIEGTATPGPVKGRVTWPGRGCGAQDEPAEGTWDGRELRFSFIARPNVNTQIANATYCGEGRIRIVLRRKDGTSNFEGDGTLNDRPPVFQVTASP